MALASLRKGDPSRIGQYRLVARLGAGGMGVVYLGETKGRGPVAIKVVRPEVGDDEEFRARFRREVSLLTRVQGLCTVKVVEADTESATPFLVTEYAAGPSLAEHVRNSGPLDADMLYGLATGLAEALEAIHLAGVVHRDLKPGNVILTAQGPKVIDFGIAQPLDGTVLTRTGALIGSPGFMAPEQVVGKPGKAADVFAWGLTVAYAASGRQPFGTGPAEVLPYRVVHESPDIADVPESLRPLVEAAVSKDPSARPASRELREQLTAGAENGRSQPRSTESDDEHGTSTQLVLSRTWQPPTEIVASLAPQDARPPRRRRSLTVLAGAAGLTLAISAGVAYAIGSGGHSTASGAAGTGTTVADSTLPTVTFGGYTGRKPTAIDLDSADGGGTIGQIRWTSWTATGAVGQGSLGTVSTQVTLSAPVGGRFTRMGETTNGELTIAVYQKDGWPTGASAPAQACEKPTAAQLLTAWRAAPAAVRGGWADPSAAMTGFDSIECWEDWVVAEATGEGDGEIVFSWSGGLHPVPESDLQQFSDTVCKDPTAPLGWKSPDLGPAVC